MTDTTIAPSANEAVWHAAGAALYGGDIDTFLAHWQPDGRYEVAYPIAGMPRSSPVTTSYASCSPASRRSPPGSASTTSASTPPPIPTSPSSRSV